jgi:hypothetical protein
MYSATRVYRFANSDAVICGAAAQFILGTFLASSRLYRLLPAILCTRIRIFSHFCRTYHDAIDWHFRILKATVDHVGQGSSLFLTFSGWVILALYRIFNCALRGTIFAVESALPYLIQILHWMRSEALLFRSRINDFVLGPPSLNRLTRRDVLEWNGLPNITCALISQSEPDVAGPGV